MNRIFADAYFFFAILNPHDTAHAKAIHVAGQRRGPLVTSAWVLTEVADGLASTPRRQVFRQLLFALYVLWELFVPKVNY